MSAHRGLTVNGFPNMFFLIGPNTGLGHNSIVVMIEAQLRYLLDVLTQMDARGLGCIEPRPEVQAAYNDRLQSALAGTVWNTGGCASWYLDEHGVMADCHQRSPLGNHWAPAVFRSPKPRQF